MCYLASFQFIVLGLHCSCLVVFIEFRHCAFYFVWAYIHTHTHTHTRVYIFVYGTVLFCIAVCVCVCVCARVCECVCVCVFVLGQTKLQSTLYLPSAPVLYHTRFSTWGILLACVSWVLALHLLFPEVLSWPQVVSFLSCADHFSTVWGHRRLCGAVEPVAHQWCSALRLATFGLPKFQSPSSQHRRPLDSCLSPPWTVGWGNFRAYLIFPISQIPVLCCQDI
jgi:hypothetical protein